MAAETTRYAVEIPKLGCFILTHDWNGEVKGLKAWPRDERPTADRCSGASASWWASAC